MKTKGVVEMTCSNNKPVTYDTLGLYCLLTQFPALKGDNVLSYYIDKPVTFFDMMGNTKFVEFYLFVECYNQGNWTDEDFNKTVHAIEYELSHLFTINEVQLQSKPQLKYSPRQAKFKLVYHI